MIAAWLAGKLSGMIIFVLACFGAILIPVTIYQTVQIYGAGFSLPIIGHVNIVTGLKPEITSLNGLLDKANLKVQQVSDECSRHTRELEAVGNKAVADQKALTDKAEAELAKEQEANKKRTAHLMEILNNAKKSDERPLGPAVLQYLDSLRTGQR